MAGQVIETVRRVFPDVIFAYQTDALARPTRPGRPPGVEGIDPKASLLLAAGDRIVDPIVLEQLFDLFSDGGSIWRSPPRPPGGSTGAPCRIGRRRPFGRRPRTPISQRQVFRISGRLRGGALVRGNGQGDHRPGILSAQAPVPEGKLAAAFGEL